MNARAQKAALAATAFMVSLVTIWLAGFAVFVYAVGGFTVPPASVRTDAIIVLTGGAERINTGLDLLQRGSAGKLLISGVDERVSLDKIMSMWNGSLDNPDCCIFLGHMAQNTKENAIEARQWADQMYVSSIRLVTSGTHLPRAIVEFHHALPQSKILPHPVFPNNEAGQNAFMPALSGMLQEYNKTILSIVRISLDFTGG